MNINSNISNLSSTFDKFSVPSAKLEEGLSKNFAVEEIKPIASGNVQDINFSFSASYIEPSNNYQIKNLAANINEHNFVENDDQARKQYLLNSENENSKPKSIKFSFNNALSDCVDVEDKLNLYSKNQNYNQVSKINETVQAFNIGYNLRSDAMNSYEFTKNLTKVTTPKLEYMHKFNESFEQYI